MALSMVSYILEVIERDSLILKDFSLKTIYSSTYDTTIILFQYRIDRKLNHMLHASL